MLLFASFAVTIAAVGFLSIPSIGYMSGSALKPLLTPAVVPDLIVYCDNLKNTTVKAAQQDAPLINNCFLTATTKNIAIKKLSLQLDGTAQNNSLVGDNDTKYFSDIKIKSGINGITLMGPTGITLSAASSSASSTGFVPSSTWMLTDTFVIRAGQTLPLLLSADISAFEDTAGQFFGRDYHARVNTLTVNDVCIADITGICTPNAAAAIIKNTGSMQNTFQTTK